MAVSAARRRAIVRYRERHPERVANTAALYYQKNRDRIRAAQNDRKRKGRTQEAKRLGLILSQAGTRARRKDIAFEIDREWLAGEIEAQGGRCAMSGVLFEYSEAHFHPWTPSLDRISLEEGYTHKNTRVVCWMWNSAKGMAKDTQVIEFARAVMEKWGTMPIETKSSSSED